MNFEEIRKPIPLEGLQFFPGALNREKTEGLILAYIDATFAAQRLDEACGPGQWDLSDSKPVYEGDRVVCVERTLKLRIGDEWVGRTDYGYPNGPDDSEPIKSMASDALKRCCWLWGVGRELRRGPNVWWPVTGEGKFKRFATGAGQEYWRRATGGAVASQKGTQTPQNRRSAPATGGDTPEGDRGVCPVHGVPFTHKVGHSEKTGKDFDFWSCPVKNDDGSRCGRKPEKDTKGEQSLADSAPAEDEGDWPEAGSGAGRGGDEMTTKEWTQFLKIELRARGIKKDERRKLIAEWAKARDIAHVPPDKDWNAPLYASFWEWYTKEKEGSE